MNKQQVVGKIIAHLEQEIELFRRAAKSAFEEATHEQSKAENKYDTRGLEASYLARGQARQVADAEDALAQFRTLFLAGSVAQTEVCSGALVELERGRAREWYYVAPCAGGTEVQHDGQDILVITPQSPLGRQLIGRSPGESVTLAIGGKNQRQKVITVL